MSNRSERKKRLQSIFAGTGGKLENREAAVKSIKKALKRGLIRRPNYCCWCKKRPGKDAKGNPMIEAVHLRGYGLEHRFDFEWLCVSCRSKAIWAKKARKT